MPEEYSLCVCVCVCVCIYIHIHIFYIHLSIEKPLGCFHILVIMNSAIMNMGVQILL